MCCYSLAELPSWRTAPHRLATGAYYIYSQLLFITGGSVLQAQPADEPCLRDKGPPHTRLCCKGGQRSYRQKCGHFNRIESGTAESRLTVMRQRHGPLVSLSHCICRWMKRKFCIRRHLGASDSNLWAGRNLVSVQRSGQETKCSP